MVSLPLAAVRRSAGNDNMGSVRAVTLLVSAKPNIQKMRDSYVYILASKRYGTLYTGVTSDLAERVYQHKHDLLVGFTKRHGFQDLVCFEMHADIQDAIAREKQIKGWNRAWKI